MINIYFSISLGDNYCINETQIPCTLEAGTKILVWHLWLFGQMAWTNHRIIL